MLQIDPFATTTNGLYLPKPDKTILNPTAIKSILFLYSIYLFHHLQRIELPLPSCLF